MVVIKEPVLYVDVDDTLVSWDFHFGSQYESKTEFVDPADGKPLFLQVIQATVDAMKSHRIRGHSIIVWSAGGADWAREVVFRLGLDEMVDACISKPSWILDDLPASEFIPERIRRDLSKPKPERIKGWPRAWEDIKDQDTAELTEEEKALLK